MIEQFKTVALATLLLGLGYLASEVHSIRQEIQNLSGFCEHGEEN